MKDQLDEAMAYNEQLTKNAAPLAPVMEESPNTDLERIKDLESQLSKAHQSIKIQTKEVNKVSRQKEQIESQLQSLI